MLLVSCKNYMQKKCQHMLHAHARNSQHMYVQKLPTLVRFVLTGECLATTPNFPLWPIFLQERQCLVSQHPLKIQDIFTLVGAHVVKI